MLIKYNLKKGDISQYNTTVCSAREATEGSYYEKSESKMEMSMTQQVVDVSHNGDMILKVTIDSSTLLKDGKEIPTKKKNRVFNMKMADNGQVIESSGTGPESPPLFPSGDVNLNDTWISEKEIQIPSKSDSINLKTYYKFDSIEKFRGFECARIVIKTEEVNLEFEEGVTQAIGGDGVTYFCYGEGKLIRSEVNTYTRTSLSEAEIKIITQVTVDYAANNRGESTISGGNFLLSL